jgi:predicted GH43/DUF377 family glycosyl hydrolase
MSFLKLGEGAYETPVQPCNTAVPICEGSRHLKRNKHISAVAGVFILTLASSLWAQESWVIGPWTRASEVPVIRPNLGSEFVDPLTGKIVNWEALHTFNPAAIVRNGKIVVLYRAEDDSGKMAIGSHTSRLGMAVSDDGIHFQRMPEPVFFPTHDAQEERESSGGVEDPRLVEAPDGTYILTYTQWSRSKGVYTIGVASSRDLQHWTKFGPIFGITGPYALLKYKSSGIVTRVQKGRLIAAKIHGKYWMYWGEIEIHLATSTDLIHWQPIEDAPGQPKVLLRKRPGERAPSPKRGRQPYGPPTGSFLYTTRKTPQTTRWTKLSVPKHTACRRHCSISTRLSG